MGVILDGVTQHVVIVETNLWHILRLYRLYVCLHVEKRAEGELAGLSGALAVGEGAAGGKHVEAQLQHIVLADGAHAALGLCHLGEFLGGLQVLAGDINLLAGQQQREVEADGLHGHLLRLGEESGLCLAVAERLDAAVPLQVVHAEEGLREGDGDRQRHEMVARSAAARQRHLRKQVGPIAAPLPVCRAQFAQSHGGVNALTTRNCNAVIEGETQLIALH